MINLKNSLNEIKNSFLIDNQIEDERYVKSKVADGLNIKDLENKMIEYYKSEQYGQCEQLYKTYGVKYHYKPGKVSFNNEIARICLNYINKYNLDFFDFNWIDTALVTNMSAAFKYTRFNFDISEWDVSNVTDMSYMFVGCSKFNCDLSKWDVSFVQNMYHMFENCSVFNSPLNTWDTCRVEDMSEMFVNCTEFNQDISSWNVSNVTAMNSMFERCKKFNQPLNDWDVSKVTDMNGMFCGCEEFNQPLDKWDVSSLVSMNAMFFSCEKFNQPLSSWKDKLKNVRQACQVFQYSGYDQELDWALENAKVDNFIQADKYDMVVKYVKKHE